MNRKPAANFKKIIQINGIFYDLLTSPASVTFDKIFYSFNNFKCQTHIKALEHLATKPRDNTTQSQGP